MGHAATKLVPCRIVVCMPALHIGRGVHPVRDAADAVKNPH